MIECPDIEARPILDERGFAIAFDLWVAGRWVGSRCTVEQCEMYLSHLIGIEIESTFRGAW